MVFLLDGVFGIGKTSVLNEIEKQYCGKNNLIMLESDYFFQKYLHREVNKARKEHRIAATGGMLPQNNIEFLKEYRNIILEKSKDCIVISDMSLTMPECKAIIHDFLENNSPYMIHVILEADKELIKKRIRQDENQQRDKKLALDTMDEFSDFINKNYENAMRITTDNKNVEEVAKEILEIIDDYILKNNL